MKTGNRKFGTHIFLPIGLAILALLAVSAAAIYWQEQHYLNKDVQVRLEQVRRLLNIHIKEDSLVLNAITDLVRNDKNIQTAWLAKDRDALLACTTPLLKNIHDKYDVTHFYFHDANEVCFLRVHDPLNYSNRNNKFILDEATHKKDAVYGIALGTYGTLSLRYAQPWYMDNKPVGFIELARKIEHIAAEMKESLDVEFFFVIKKSWLSRPNWEYGLKMMGRQGNWELLPELVITDRTIKQVPTKFPSIVSKACRANETAFFEIPADNQTYRAGLVPLFDIAGNELGSIVVMKDITQNQAALRNLLAVLISVSVLIGGALFIFFHWYIRRIEISSPSPCGNLNIEIGKPQQVHDETKVCAKE